LSGNAYISAMVTFYSVILMQCHVSVTYVTPICLVMSLSSI